jgi:RimJ/RimL family protein N-acetyltransferase
MKIYLETERLTLRQFTEQDLDNLYNLDSDPDVVRLASRTGKPTEYTVIKTETLPSIIKYYQKYENFGCWATIEKSTNEFIGWFLFRPNLDNPVINNDEIELGYRLKKSAWGKGYATEASTALILKGFTELNVKCVVATSLVANTASIRVMEKVGLKLERYFTETRFLGENKEAAKYSLDRNSFLSIYNHLK